MQRDTSLISKNERQFILKALKEDLRVDGRTPYDHRKITYEFAPDDRGATVNIGQTKVMTVITPTLASPYEDRPSEGSVRFNVEFSPMASPTFEGGRPGEAAIEATRLLERAFRDSRAIDQEALCVLAGHKVWQLSIDVHVLDHCGNLTDACMLSTLAALMAFRRPDVEVAAGGSGDSATVTVLSPSIREPVPLSLHHLPLAVTFALFEDGELLAVDPSEREEAAAEGALTVVLNTHSDVCAVRKCSGVGISMTQVHRIMRLANSRAGELMADLKTALNSHDTSRVASRVRRQSGVSSLPWSSSRAVTVLQSEDISGDAGEQHASHSAQAAVSLAFEDGSSGGGSSSEDEEHEQEDETLRAEYMGNDEALTTGVTASEPHIMMNNSKPVEQLASTAVSLANVNLQGNGGKGGVRSEHLSEHNGVDDLEDILGGSGTLQEDLAALQKTFKRKR